MLTRMQCMSSLGITSSVRGPYRVSQLSSSDYHSTVSTVLYDSSFNCTLSFCVPHNDGVMIITPTALHATVGELVLKIVLRTHAHPWITQLFVISPYSLTPRQSTIWLLIRLTAGNIPQRNTAILYITARLGVASSEREHSRHLHGSHKQREMKETHIVSEQPSAASPYLEKYFIYTYMCMFVCDKCRAPSSHFLQYTFTTFLKKKSHSCRAFASWTKSPLTISNRTKNTLNI